MTNKDKFAYTVDEACAAIGIGRTKFYALCTQGKIDLRKIGGRTVATAKSLQRLVDEAEVVQVRGVDKPFTSYAALPPAGEPLPTRHRE